MEADRKGYHSSRSPITSERRRDRERDVEAEREAWKEHFYEVSKGRGSVPDRVWSNIKREPGGGKRNGLKGGRLTSSSTNARCTPYTEAASASDGWALR